MSYFFTITGEEIVDKGILLKEKDPILAKKLQQRLKFIDNPLKVAEILQEVLLARINEIDPIDSLDKAMQLIYKENENIRNGELAGAVKVSERQL